MKYHNLQALRGIAALAVVLYHVVNHVDPDRLALPKLVYIYTFDRMPVAVEAFFVISGFIMTYTALLRDAGPESPWVFFVKRFFRIAPLYWLTVSFLTFFLFRADATRYLSNLAFIPTNAEGTAPAFGPPINYSGWTLNYEVYFYMVFFVALFFGRRAIFVLAAMFATVLLAAPLYLTGRITFDPTSSYGFSTAYLNMMMNPLNWDFVAGIVCAYLVRWADGRFSKRALGYAAIGSVLLAFAAAMLSRSTFSLWSVALPAAILVGCLAAADSKFDLRLGPLPKLGDISYSLYLVHPLVLLAFDRILPKADPGAWHVILIAVIMFTGICIVLAAISYRYIEKPMMRVGSDICAKLERRKPAWRTGKSGQPVQAA